MTVADAPEWHKRRRLQTTGLIACLCILLLAAVGFTVSAVQVQSAVAGYIGGNSIWSRAQMAAIVHLDRYAQAGQTEDLVTATRWLDIPMGDLQARQAMEAAHLNESEARAGLLRGKNHPDDMAGMIWLFRNFADTGPFKKAVEAWRDTDPYLLEMQRISEDLREAWEASPPDRSRISELQRQLRRVNQKLEPLVEQFRVAMGEAARWTTNILSLASVLILGLIALFAWRLSNRLVLLVRRSEQKFRAIFEQTGVGVLQVALQGQILDANQAACEILDRPLEKLLTSRFQDNISPDDSELSQQPRQHLISGHIESYTVEQRLYRGGGDLVWARLTVSMVRNSSALDAYLIVMLEDISESRHLAAELSFQATHDELTDLLNRREFERRLASVLGRARSERSHHALCFFDLDQFKLVNDTSGHGAGDQLLRQVARAASETLRDGDILARLGGDEFGLILENCTLETASVVAEKLRQTLESIIFIWEGDHHSIGASIGVVAITADAPHVTELLRSVDLACYMAKDGGRNRIYVSAEDDQQLHVQRGEMAWLNKIQTALTENRFYLDAQRISPAGPEHKGLRYEVLIRLLNEQGEVVPPSAFLPAAERFGIISKIDRWVISEVIRQFSAAPGHLDKLEACHINLSGRSFDQPDFTDFVIDLIRGACIPGRKICFEITETAAVRNLVDVQTFMQRLTELGCTFALDDFGTGLSSFSYLQQLSVTYLKIDGVFVRDIAHDTTSFAMVKAIHDIGHTLGKQTIAEFVEDDEAVRVLQDIGVNYLQGFGLHRPCRFADLLNVQSTLRADREGGQKLISPESLGRFRRCNPGRS